MISFSHARCAPCVRRLGSHTVAYSDKSRPRLVGAHLRTACVVRQILKLSQSVAPAPFPARASSRLSLGRYSDLHGTGQRPAQTRVRFPGGAAGLACTTRRWVGRPGRAGPRRWALGPAAASWCIKSYITNTHIP